MHVNYPDALGKLPSQVAMESRSKLVQRQASGVLHAEIDGPSAAPTRRAGQAWTEVEHPTARKSCHNERP